MRVAQHARPQQLGVRLDLARRVQAAAGVVEVDLAAFVEAGVFRTPQLRKSPVRVDINDMSSVVAASTIHGHAAASYGVIVKLTRTLAIIPICLGLATVRGRHGKNATEGPTARRVSVRRILPVFMAAFIAAVAANTIGLVPVAWHHGLSDLSTWMITAALAAIGLSTDVHHIRRAGVRPLALGAVLWATVALTSLGLQALTGTF